MGTKLKGAINPLSSNLQSSNSCSFTVHFVDDYFQTRSVKENCQKFQSSMDRAPARHNKESIRKTMQMHENIFKHQVRELHRLYSVQKMLIDELKKDIKENTSWATPMTSSDTNQSQFINRQQHLTTQTACGYNFEVQADPRSRERSGSCSGDTMKIARGFDLERPAGEDISAEASAVEEDQAGASSLMHSRINHMSIEGSDGDSEVELTLSIGGNSSSRKMAKDSKSKPNNQELGWCNSQPIHRELDSTASFKSERGEDCSGPNTPMSSSSTATVDQERKRPQWLFKGLNINRT